MNRSGSIEKELDHVILEDGAVTLCDRGAHLVHLRLEAFEGDVKMRRIVGHVNGCLLRGRFSTVVEDKAGRLCRLTPARIIQAAIDHGGLRRRSGQREVRRLSPFRRGSAGRQAREHQRGREEGDWLLP